MLNIFGSVIDTSNITSGAILLCTASAILLGLAVAWIHSYKNRSNNSFLLSVSLIPVIVQVIIMLVNGNLGTGVAVAGAFGFVRFRSAPGTAREISSLFLAMTIGLATGMGYIAVAFLLTLIVGLLTILSLQFFTDIHSSRILSVTVPEVLDYEGVFEEVLSKYTVNYQLISVKSVAMGTMYRIMYEVETKDPDQTKEFLDSLRIRNGNLEVSLSRRYDKTEEIAL